MALEAEKQARKEQEMQEQLDSSKEKGQNDLIELFEKVKKELEARKRENEELRQMIEVENQKRMHESERIKERLEREKQELRDYLGKLLCTVTCVVKIRHLNSTYCNGNGPFKCTSSKNPTTFCEHVHKANNFLSANFVEKYVYKAVNRNNIKLE